MNGILIDDELSARTVISHLCSKTPQLNLIGEFDNAIAAIKFLNQHQVDVVFLDLHMPNFSGIDFLQTLKHPPSIVLTTSDTNFALDAYQYEHIVDYLVKPVTKERFDLALRKITGSRTSKAQPLQTGAPDTSNDLYINIDRRLIKLNIPDILLIEAQGDYIVIKTLKNQYKVHTTLKKIREKLPDALFLQIHRSYIINFTQIVDIEDNSVLIEKNVIPISRSNRPELMTRLNLL
ncbi:LytR/AlgR family response regulator transcription factor [Maribacter sp. 2307ULW6-5]|uniref:LytR/AlgR family response regulator transcription factor n=1 Tax=Maribacter sp. 2307ULW6-5 TaxID=3386275 RepID=UPI0039BCC302